MKLFISCNSYCVEQNDLEAIVQGNPDHSPIERACWAVTVERRTSESCMGLGDQQILMKRVKLFYCVEYGSEPGQTHSEHRSMSFFQSVTSRRNKHICSLYFRHIHDKICSHFKLTIYYFICLRTLTSHIHLHSAAWERGFLWAELAWGTHSDRGCQLRPNSFF